MFQGKRTAAIMVAAVLLAIIGGVNVLIQKPLLAQSIRENSKEDNTDKIAIERIQFKGNTAFTDEELRTVVSNYQKRAISFAEIVEMRNLVAEHYRTQGYTTSTVTIPLQNFVDGVVTLEVVEGSLSAIEIEGIRTYALTE